MPRINLDELARELNWQGKRADELILTKNAIIIIERTGEPNIDDLKKLDETIEMLQKGELDYLQMQYGDYMSEYHGNSVPKIIAIVCKRKGQDLSFVRYTIDGRRILCANIVTNQ